MPTYIYYVLLFVFPYFQLTAEKWSSRNINYSLRNFFFFFLQWILGAPFWILNGCESPEMWGAVFIPDARSLAAGLSSARRHTFSPSPSPFLRSVQTEMCIKVFVQRTQAGGGHAYVNEPQPCYVPHPVLFGHSHKNVGDVSASFLTGTLKGVTRGIDLLNTRGSANSHLKCFSGVVL